MVVLDTSALLAYLFREAGHEVVEEYIESTCISTVNLSEVAGRFLLVMALTQPCYFSRYSKLQ